MSPCHKSKGSVQQSCSNKCHENHEIGPKNNQDMKQNFHPQSSLRFRWSQKSPELANCEQPMNWTAPTPGTAITTKLKDVTKPTCSFLLHHFCQHLTSMGFSIFDLFGRICLRQPHLKFYTIFFHSFILKLGGTKICFVLKYIRLASGYLISVACDAVSVT